jgi:hypothetical protein
VKTSALFRYGEKLIICAPAPSILGLTTSVSIPDFKLMPHDCSFHTASAQRRHSRLTEIGTFATVPKRRFTIVPSSIYQGETPLVSTKLPLAASPSCSKSGFLLGS